MTDKVQEIRYVRGILQNEPKATEIINNLLTELDAAQKRIALLENDKEFFIKETNSTKKQLDTAKQENESLRYDCRSLHDTRNGLVRKNEALQQQLKQAIHPLKEAHRLLELHRTAEAHATLTAAMNTVVEQVEKENTHEK